jgi:hypothetical protein
VKELAVNDRSLFLPRWDSKGKLIAAEDRINKTIVVFDMHRKHIALNLPGQARTQRFLEIWNFDIF